MNAFKHTVGAILAAPLLWWLALAPFAAPTLAAEPKSPCPDAGH